MSAFNTFLAATSGFEFYQDLLRFVIFAFVIYSLPGFVAFVRCHNQRLANGGIFLSLGVLRCAAAWPRRSSASVPANSGR